MNRSVKPEQSEMTSDFPPVCPNCGARMGWEDDQMLTSTGYIDDSEKDVPRDEYGIRVDDAVVHMFFCQKCETFTEYEDLGEGNLALLSTARVIDDEPDFRYSEYARKRYIEDNTETTTK